VREGAAVAVAVFVACMASLLYLLYLLPSKCARNFLIVWAYILPVPADVVGRTFCLLCLRAWRLCAIRPTALPVYLMNYCRNWFEKEKKKKKKTFGAAFSRRDCT
jgi:hypothetical protein